MCGVSRTGNGGKIRSDLVGFVSSHFVSFRLALSRFVSFLVSLFCVPYVFFVCVSVTFGGVLTKLARRESNQHRVNVSHVIV